MWRIASTVWAVIFAVSILGCGGADEPGQAPAGDSESQAEDSAAAVEKTEKNGPREALAVFLEAVRTGDDEQAAMMLTPLARKKTAELNMEVAPPGSDTARFEVGRVEYIAKDGARVTTTWSDLDQNSQRKSDEIIWMVRQEPEGWRIGGVAATIFEGEPPLLLNFEDPEEMLRKQEWVKQETARRAQAAAQARGIAPPEDPIRR